jgi:hypothetical protein
MDRSLRSSTGYSDVAGDITIQTRSEVRHTIGDTVHIPYFLAHNRLRARSRRNARHHRKIIASQQEFERRALRRLYTIARLNNSLACSKFQLLLHAPISVS